MFWLGKNKKTDKQKHKLQAEEGSGKNPKNSKTGQDQKEKTVGTGNSQRNTSQKIREEALANARKARTVLGDETIQKIAAAMHKKQQSSLEQAKTKIATADSGRVVDEILYMLDKNNQ